MSNDTTQHTPPTGVRVMASETLAKIDRAYDVASALCEGEREWLISIPARPDHDPDLIIGDALLAARNEIARLTAELDAARERERECREVLVNVRDALIVLSDDTWDLTVAKPRKKDSDTLYAWTVGHYRRMREADAMLDRALASTPPDTEGQP